MNLKQLPRWLRDHYLAVGLLMLSGLSQSLFAATLIVNSLEDTTLADGQCTLREALENANQDTAGVGDCIAGNGDDVIDLTGLKGTITLSAQLEITSNLILKGPGAEKLTLSGNNQTNVFYIYSYPDTISVQINGVKVIKGNGNGDCQEGIAGGITNINSILTINNSTISENSGGGICSCSYGTLTLVNSTVSMNDSHGIDSTECGSVGRGPTHITNSVVSGNNGVGISIGRGISTITDSTVSGNLNSWGSGGGIYQWNGTLTITNSMISGNSAGYGGGIYGVSNLIIKNSTISNNFAEYDSGGILYGGGKLTIEHSTISRNSSNYGSGGIYNGGNLIITNSTVSDNFVKFWGTAGGIDSESEGNLTIDNSIISRNFGGDGGGIFISGGGTSNINNSTVSGNSGYIGGGIFKWSSDTLTITNSTVSGNSATAPIEEYYSAGGICDEGGLNSAHDSLILINSTISANSANYVGGILNGGYLTLKNTLVANNTNGDCYHPDLGSSLYNINHINSFIGDGSCDPTFSGDPKLGPLANNGGPTFTHALRRGSPAIDVGDDTICAAKPVNGLDQRGVARFGSLAGNHCDIGAYEYQKPALATLGSFTIDSNAIKWETLAEQGTQGFYLWQAEPVIAGTCEAFTNPQLVISKPISAKGSEVQGEAYQAAVAVNLNGCYGIQEIPSGQIYVTPQPGINEWTGEQWLTR